MTFTEIFSKSYLFQAISPQDNQYLLEQMIGFGILIVISIVYLLIKKMDVKVRFRHFYCFLTAGVLGYIYLFARYEGLAWLGSRLFFVLIILMLIVWTIINTAWLVKYSKKLQNKKVLEDRYEKYLPKKKNKAKQN